MSCSWRTLPKSSELSEVQVPLQRSILSCLQGCPLQGTHGIWDKNKSPNQLQQSQPQNLLPQGSSPSLQTKRKPKKTQFMSMARIWGRFSSFSVAGKVEWMQQWWVGCVDLNLGVLSGCCWSLRGLLILSSSSRFPDNLQWNWGWILDWNDSLVTFTGFQCCPTQEQSVRLVEGEETNQSLLSRIPVWTWFSSWKQPLECVYSHVLKAVVPEQPLKRFLWISNRTCATSPWTASKGCCSAPEVSPVLLSWDVKAPHRTGLHLFQGFWGWNWLCSTEATGGRNALAIGRSWSHYNEYPQEFGEQGGIFFPPGHITITQNFQKTDPN